MTGRLIICDDRFSRDRNVPGHGLVMRGGWDACECGDLFYMAHQHALHLRDLVEEPTDADS